MAIPVRWSRGRSLRRRYGLNSSLQQWFKKKRKKDRSLNEQTVFDPRSANPACCCTSTQKQRLWPRGFWNAVRPAAALMTTRRPSRSAWTCITKQPSQWLPFMRAVVLSGRCVRLLRQRKNNIWISRETSTYILTHPLSSYFAQVDSELPVDDVFGQVSKAIDAL